MQHPPPDERRHSWGRTANVEEHIALLRSEFVGLPEVCHAHAALVVRIRRGLDLDANVASFFDLWASRANELAPALSSRWLVSACDTFADHGTPFQRAAGMMLSSTINMLKLAETERLLTRDPAIDPAKLSELRRRHAERTHVELWDGMTAFAVDAGDMPRNLFRRIRALLADDPALGAIAAALFERALVSDTLLGRFAALNPRFAFNPPPA